MDSVTNAIAQEITAQLFASASSASDTEEEERQAQLSRVQGNWQQVENYSEEEEGPTRRGETVHRSQVNGFSRGTITIPNPAPKKRKFFNTQVPLGGLGNGNMMFSKIATVREFRTEFPGSFGSGLGMGLAEEGMDVEMEGSD